MPAGRSLEEDGGSVLSKTNSLYMNMNGQGDDARSGLPSVLGVEAHCIAPALERQWWVGLRSGSGSG